MAQEERGSKDGRGRGIMLPGLARARADAGYSFRGLEEASGVPRSVISKIERGRSGAQSRTVKRLAEALGVPTPVLTREPSEGRALTREVAGALIASARAEAERTGEPFEDVLAALLASGVGGGGSFAGDGDEAARPRKPVGTALAGADRPWLQEPLAAAYVSEER